MNNKNYIPALKLHFLTPFYDIFLPILLPEKKLKEKILMTAHITKNDKILDFGCGTGNLMLMFLKHIEGVQIFGVDVDDKITGIAKRKLRENNLKAEILIYDGKNLPFPDEHFTVVVSTLVFHHLRPGQKIPALREIHRVLKKGGHIIIGDFGKPRNGVMRILSFFLSILEPTEENINGLIPAFMSDAGFVQIHEDYTMMTLFGNIDITCGVKG